VKSRDAGCERRRYRVGLWRRGLLSGERDWKSEARYGNAK